jgi:copper homeostasis protein
MLVCDTAFPEIDIEVIAASVQDALAAQAAGATRIELVREIDQDGLTPNLGLVREVCEAVRIPVRVMLRDANSFVVEDIHALDKLCASARALAMLPIDGLVLGFLRKNGEFDSYSLAAISECAPAAHITFHRAVEQARDPLRLLRELRWFPQVDRVLASGAPGALHERIARLTQWQLAMPLGVRLVAGGGVSLESAAALHMCAGIRCFHFGRAVRCDADMGRSIDAARVAQLRVALGLRPV